VREGGVYVRPPRFPAFGSYRSPGFQSTAWPLSANQPENDSNEQRISQIAREPTPAEVDARAVRLQAIQRDAEELSGLSASVQSDLQQLGKGLLAKDLDARLKKMEKLSKRLRQELEQ
jgi:hypothetical protein